MNKRSDRLKLRVRELEPNDGLPKARQLRDNGELKSVGQ